MILITADLHLSDNQRDYYRHQWIGESLPKLMARQHKVECLLVLGDICEAKDYHSAWLVNKVVDHFYKLASLCPVVVLRGNHDYLTSADDPFYQFLKRIEGIHWINGPWESRGEFQLMNLNLLGNSLFLPHTTNYQRDWKSLNFKKYDWIFAHQTFQDADNGHGFRLDGIPLDVFPRNARVISGDVHKPQTLGCVTYTGAPYTVDFGDDYEPRVLLLDGNKVKSIPCPGPQKRLVEVELNKFSTIGLSKGDILKVRVSVSSKDMENWPEIKDKINEWGERYGFVIHQIVPVQTGKTASKKTVMSKARTDEQIFLDYVKARKIDERITKTGRLLMQKG